MLTQKQKGIIMCILAALSWGWIGIFVKKIEGITPFGIASFRLFFGVAGITLVIQLSKKWGELKRSIKDLKYLVPLSLLMSAHFIFGITAYHGTTVANGSILLNTTSSHLF